MRKSKADAALTRRRIVETAAAKFRRNGIHETGLAEVMAAAGLTQGGFYRHFDSKDQLVAEACAAGALAVGSAVADAAASEECGPDMLKRIVEGYLSTGHRDDRADGCSLASLGSELARANDGARACASARSQQIIGIIARQFPKLSAEAAKARASFVLSAMVGAVILSRIVTDAELSDLILQSAKDGLVTA
jgi:TetR/AcrR family transcriptional regulator, transcriptional repressor for nem operon